MIKIYYEPLIGHAVPDAMVPIYVQGVINALSTEEGKQGDVTRTISTGLIIDELRLQILKGNLNPENLVVIYRGEELQFNDFGIPANNDHWPRGMFEFTDDLVNRIVRAQCDLSRKKREAANVPL